MSSGNTVVQHIAKVQNMVAQLSDVSAVVSDVTIMAKVLASLSSKYSTFLTAWDSVDPGRQSMEHLQERLIREKVRLTGKSEPRGAFSAFRKNNAGNNEQSSAKSNKKLRIPKDIECFKCKEKGHYARECKKEKREKAEGVESESRKSCDCAFVAERTGTKVGKEGDTSLPVDIIEAVLNADTDEIPDNKILPRYRYDKRTSYFVYRYCTYHIRAYRRRTLSVHRIDT